VPSAALDEWIVTGVDKKGGKRAAAVRVEGQRWMGLILKWELMRLNTRHFRSCVAQHSEPASESRYYDCVQYNYTQSIMPEV
jgi:hypothetical protein